MFSGTVIYGNMHSNVLLKVECTPFKIVLQMHVLFELLFDALNNRNPRPCSHYVISSEGVMQCNVIACLCFSLFLNAKLMFALSFTFSINIFSSVFLL